MALLLHQAHQIRRRLVAVERRATAELDEPGEAFVGLRAAPVPQTDGIEVGERIGVDGGRTAERDKRREFVAGGQAPFAARLFGGLLPVELFRLAGRALLPRPGHPNGYAD